MEVTYSISSEAPLVSIVCPTFNQENYIAQTIEGFISQRTLIPFEIIIHDDASTDKTAAIVKECQRLHPELITVIQQAENQYSKGIRVVPLAFSFARGEFIAYCEGDDYWIDAHKLEKQARFLLENPEYGVVFSRAKILYESTQKLMASPNVSRFNKLSRDEQRVALCSGNPFVACTSMFRKSAVDGYWEIAKKLHARLDDLAIWFYILESKKIWFLDDLTAVYRVLPSSASHFTNLTGKVSFQKSVYKVTLYFNRRFGSVVEKQKIRKRYAELLQEYCLEKSLYKDSIRYSRSCRNWAWSFLRVLARPFYFKLKLARLFFNRHLARYKTQI